MRYILLLSLLIFFGASSCSKNNEPIKYTQVRADSIQVISVAFRNLDSAFYDSNGRIDLMLQFFQTFDYKRTEFKAGNISENQLPLMLYPSVGDLRSNINTDYPHRIYAFDLDSTEANADFISSIGVKLTAPDVQGKPLLTLSSKDNRLKVILYLTWF